MAGSRYLSLRRPDACVVCATKLPAETHAWWDAATRKVTCVDCCRHLAENSAAPTLASVDRESVSRAGASAQREHDRRKLNHEHRVREQHPLIGGALLKLREEPQSVRAWARGAEGEALVGALLDRLASDRIQVIHDRRMPRSRANIDHLVVAPSGVYVVDAKKYSGKVERRDRGSWFRADYRLYVNGRDRSTLLESVRRQADVVQGLLPADVVVRPVLCFVGADWPTFGGAISFAEVVVTKPREVGKRIRTAGPFGDRTPDIAHRLLTALPPA
jgi:hypothetical protein